MKELQPQYRCMKGRTITLDHLQGWPSDVYPNSKVDGYHDFFEMEYFVKGEGLHFINGVPYRVQPGYLYLLIPGDFHSMQLDTRQEYELWNIKLAVDAPAPGLMEELSCFPRPLWSYLQGDTAAFFAAELHFLEACLRGDWNSHMAKNSAERLLSVLHFAISNNAAPAQISVEAPIQQLLRYIGKNYPKDITLAEAASILGLSPGYAGAYFKKATGMHFQEYLDRTRLFHAAQLLRETTCTVKEIAFAVGFHSPEYLTRRFAAAFGVSPRSYRRNCEISD